MGQARGDRDCCMTPALRHGSLVGSVRLSVGSRGGSTLACSRPSGVLGCELRVHAYGGSGLRAAGYELSIGVRPLGETGCQGSDARTSIARQLHGDGGLCRAVGDGYSVSTSATSCDHSSSSRRRMDSMSSRRLSGSVLPWAPIETSPICIVIDDTGVPSA